MKNTGIRVSPIRSDDDHQRAITRIGELMDATPGSRQEDELDLLATLVHAYESKHYPMDPPDPIGAIRFRMEQQGLTRKDLEPYLGSRARVSEVLAGKRTLTLDMVRRLREGLGIPADVLIGSSKPRLRRTPRLRATSVPATARAQRGITKNAPASRRSA